MIWPLDSVSLAPGNAGGPLTISVPEETLWKMPLAPLLILGLLAFAPVYVTLEHAQPTIFMAALPWFGADFSGRRVPWANAGCERYAWRPQQIRTEGP